MKSICIKTNDANLIDYLLNELNYIEIEPVYISSNKFKNYKNIIIHYRGNDNKKFIHEVSCILSCLVIDELEEKDELTYEEKLSLAKSKFYMGKIEEAEEIYKELGEINSVDALLIYSYVIKNLYTLEQGIKYIDKAIEIEPENPRVHLYKGIFLEEMGKSFYSLLEFYYMLCIGL